MNVVTIVDNVLMLRYVLIVISACSKGTYGSECGGTCGQCANAKICDYVTGSCPEGCEPGWKSDTCAERE